MLPANSRCGFTLIELVVSMAVGLVLLGSMLLLVTQVLTSQARSLQLSHAQEDAITALLLMTREIRRAGYHAHADEQWRVTPSLPPLFELPRYPRTDCVLFSYDANANGVHDGDTEQFGFRIHQRQLQQRQQGADCDQTGWQSITHAANVTVLALTFEPVQLTAAVLPLVRIRLRVTHPHQPQWVREYQALVTIPNGEVN